MNHITPAARRSFDEIFCAALKANLATNPSHDVAVLPVAPPTGMNEAPRTLVLLTCASLRFKLVAVFHVVDDAMAKAYFAAAPAPDAAAATAEPLEELLERGNLCCGAMNRDLLAHTPHLGLSTPSMLRGVSAKVLASLHTEHLSHFALHINGSHFLDASLCMRGQAVVDFVADVSQPSVETGELELL